MVKHIVRISVCPNPTILFLLQRYNKNLRLPKIRSKKRTASCLTTRRGIRKQLIENRVQSGLMTGRNLSPHLMGSISAAKLQRKIDIIIFFRQKLDIKSSFRFIKLKLCQFLPIFAAEMRSESLIYSHPSPKMG